MSERRTTPPADWPLQEEDMATFKALDGPTRQLVLRLIEDPTDADEAALRRHPDGVMLAAWLLTLPAYRNAPDDDEDDGDGHSVGIEEVMPGRFEATCECGQWSATAATREDLHELIGAHALEAWTD